MGAVAQGVSLRVRRKKRGSRFRGNDIGIMQRGSRLRGNDIGIMLAIAGIYA